MKTVDRPGRPASGSTIRAVTNSCHPSPRRQGKRLPQSASVERKSNDLVTQHSSFTGRPTSGNRFDQVVVDAFRERPDDMRAEAAAIEETLLRWADEAPPPIPDPDGDIAGDEGGILLKEHLRRERDATLKTRKLEQAKAQGIPVACEVCGFDFFVVYGPRGRDDYIECHHRTPLHVTGPVRTRLQDLALICSNCHRMIHRVSPWLAVEDLEELLRQRPASADN